MKKSTLIGWALLGLFGLILYGLGSALIPLLLSFLLAYLLFPVVRRLEKAGIKRQTATLSTFGLAAILAVLILVLVVPGIIQDIKKLMLQFPDFVALTMGKLEAAALSRGFDVSLDKDSVLGFIAERSQMVSSSVLKAFAGGLKGYFQGVVGALLSIINIFLLPVFFYFVITDYENLRRHFWNWVPRGIKSSLKEILADSNRIMSGYVRGQFLVVAILSLLYAVGLTVVGLKFGFVIGLLAGLLSIIPYVGVTLGVASALVVSFADFHGMGPVIAVLAVFAVVQALEGTVITPKLVGDKVGLSPLETMLALIICGNLGGLPGMIVAIPVAGILKATLARYEGAF